MFSPGNVIRRGDGAAFIAAAVEAGTSSASSRVTCGTRRVNADHAGTSSGVLTQWYVSDK